MDFTLKIYKKLLESFLSNDYKFITYREYCEGQRPEKYIILRHDVDIKVANALAVAQIEHSVGVKSSYYFRDVPQSWNEEIMQDIAAMGHEVGYHYETMTTCRGDVDAAYKLFCEVLERLRKLVEVKTICMHGSPASKWDAKDLWKKYNYRDLGIIGEPYFDTDFSKLFYITDTGHCWDGFNVSVRDKIPKYQDEWVAQGLVYHTTKEIINAIENNKFPKHLMMTTHPHRWCDFGLELIYEYCAQRMKNIIKLILIKIRKR